jgi:ribosomal protein L6P/L9E
MSRVGKLPIANPERCDNHCRRVLAVTVAGPKGTLTQFTVPGISNRSQDNGVLAVARATEEARTPRKTWS